MNKATVASLLAVSALMTPGTLSHFGNARAQAAAPAAGQVQMDPAEFAVYDNAANKQTTPQTQAPALEAYLEKYPKSAVKDDVLQRIMIAYSQFDHPKAIAAADKVLQSEPNNLQAYVIEVAYRTEAAQAQTDAAAKQSGLDAAADYAQRGLKATKPSSMTDAQFAALKAYATPTFYSTIASDDLGKKDSADAITAYKAELASMKPEAAQHPRSPSGNLLSRHRLLQLHATRLRQLHLLHHPRRGPCARPVQAAAPAARQLLLQEIPRQQRWV